MYTRKEYLHDSNRNGGKVPHRKYYGQFVTNETINRVLSGIGLERILKSTCQHFNDIPSTEWEKLTKLFPSFEGLSKAGDYYTLENAVCILKESALQIKEFYLKSNF